MSFRQQLLNGMLRRIGKRQMQHSSPEQLRRTFERQARMLFYAPRGTQRAWQSYGNVPCLELKSGSFAGRKVLLYLHGGAFIFGSPDTHAAMAASLAQLIGARAVLPKYRLAPEAAFPAAPDDVRAVWDGLLRSGVAPHDIVLGGDSAGGALAFGLVADLDAQGADQPGAVFGFSPLCDLTLSGDSFRSNAKSDVVLPAERAGELCALFLQGQQGDIARVSPLFGTFKSAPPAWITVGDTELLLDDARRIATRLRADGCQTELGVERDLPHVWPLFHNVLPEGRQTLQQLAYWIRQQQNEAAES